MEQSPMSQSCVSMRASFNVRGLMARFIIKNRLTKYQDVQAFDSEGYFFYPDLSKEDEWVFVR